VGRPFPARRRRPGRAADRAQRLRVEHQLARDAARRPADTGGARPATGAVRGDTPATPSRSAAVPAACTSFLIEPRSPSVAGSDSSPNWVICAM